MAEKPTYRELEERIRQLEAQAGEHERAEALMREREAMARATLDSPIHAVVVIDPKGTIESANEVAAQGLGRGVEELVGARMGDLLASDVLRFRAERAMEVFGSGRALSFTDHDNGRFYEHHLHPVRDGHGKVSRLVVFSRDITERKRLDEAERHARDDLEREVRDRTAQLMEVNERLRREIEKGEQTQAALQKSQERARALLNAVTETAILIDPGGTVLAANQVGAGRLGRTVGELVGTSLDNVLPPALARSRMAATDEVVRTGRPVRSVDERDGRIYDWQVYPVLDVEGKVEQLAVFAVDITDLVEAERALRESEVKYRSVVENAEEAILVIRKGMLEFLNPKVVELMGHSEEELRSRPLVEFIHPEDRDKVMKHHLGILMGEEFAQVYDFRVIQKNGNTRWAQSNGVLVSWQDRPAILEIISDVTDSRLMQEALVRSERHYRELVDNAIGGVDRVTVQGDVLYANEAMAAMLGFSCADEYMSGNVVERYRDPRLRNAFIDALRKKGKVTNYEIELLTKTGKAKTVLLNASLSGDVISGVMIDITERKLAEEALQESEERFRLAFENANIGMCLIDTQGRFMRVNEQCCEIFGYSQEELEGMGVNDITHPDDADVSPAFMERALSGEVSHVDFEKQYLNKQGHVVWARVSSSLVRDLRGTPLYFISHVQDITDRKRAEEDLRKSYDQIRNLSAHLQTVREEQRARIAREIHDELGQNLTALKMDVSWLGKRLAADQKGLLNKTKSMAKLTDATIQTVKRISAELRPSLLDDLGLEAAVEWQAEQFQLRTGISCEASIDLEGIDLPRELSTAFFRICQEALTNIARHADATEVKIDLRQEGGQIILKVCDNGEGITQKQMARAGSFGLIGIRERAHVLGGEATIQGVRDEGTTVTVRVPLNS